MPPPGAPSPPPPQHDVVVVGAGLVGLATALAWTRRGGPPPLVIEAEDGVARHQSGHNSGVVHAGVYYAPGSRKARLCRRGRAALLRLVAERGLAHEPRGKLVVATGEGDRARLDALEARARANDLVGLRRLDRAGLAAFEPEVAGREALLVPETGIVDFAAVARELARLAAGRGIELRTDTRLVAAHRRPDGLVLETTAGEIATRHLVACAGLQADRVARACGLEPGVSIVPFRGEYHRLVSSRRHLVRRHLVYPVPDPALPFLGVHLTPTVGGEVEIGPNAVLALSRHGYARGQLDLADVAALLADRGARRLVLRHARTGLAEWIRARSRRATLAAVRRLLPAVGAEDIEPSRSGVRAQAVAPDGSLVDDFRVVADDRSVHVVNAPSPAATACLAIGDHVVDVAARAFAAAGVRPAAEGSPALPEQR